MTLKRLRIMSTYLIYQARKKNLDNRILIINIILNFQNIQEQIYIYDKYLTLKYNILKYNICSKEIKVQGTRKSSQYNKEHKLPLV